MIRFFVGIAFHTSLFVWQFLFLSLLKTPIQMKKPHFFILFLCTTLFFACINDDDDDNQIIGSGIIISEDRVLDDFEGIRIDGVIEADISFAANQSVEVQGDDNIVPRIITESENNLLRINLESGNYAPGFRAKVIIKALLINLVENVGVSDINFRGFDNLDLLEVENLGVGTTVLNGRSVILEASNSGVGNIQGFNFISDTCRVSLSGVGNIQVNSNDLLEGSLSGVGNILYKGQPDIDVVVSGVGELVNAN